MPSMGHHNVRVGEAEVSAQKFFAPIQYPGVVRRRALLERILTTPSYTVVVCQAPAGHGKTTVLQQLKSEHEQGHVLTGWLSFDEADNDIRRFSLHMQALIARLVGARLENESKHSKDRQLSWRSSDWLIDRLLELGRPTAIFFDEFQVLHEPRILAFFRRLLERLPSHVRIFIGSRSLPDVGLSRLVVANQALILRADDLRFSPAEAEEFFAQADAPRVSQEELAAIYSRTDGWPAALQLFRLALASPQVRHALDDLSSYQPRELTEYLVDNVLSLQPPPVQQFLLRTALLSRLCAPLCNAVTGRDDAQEILLRLERSGLFLRALDAEMGWFKYHALFSSCLAQQLCATDPVAVLEVHRKAARWHQAYGAYEEAVYHAIACHDYAHAAEAMNIWATRLVAEAHLITVERWYDRLPFEEVARRRDLAIKVAYALVFLRRHHKLRPLLALLESWRGGDLDRTQNPDVVLSMATVCDDDVAGAFAIAKGVPMPERSPEGFAAFELAAESNLIAYCHMARGEFDEAQQWLTRARAYSDHGAASFSGGYTRGLCGVNLLLRGDLQEALGKFRAAMAEQQMHLDGSFAAAALASCYIWALYEANALDQVETVFAQYRTGVCDAVLLDFLAAAYLPMARTHDARGRPGAAQALLEEAESIAHANGWARLVRMVQWERVRRCLAAGDVERATAMAAQISPAPAHTSSWRLFSEDLVDERLERIRLGIYSFDLGSAATALQEEMVHQRNRVSRQIKLALLEALLYERKGVRNLAHRSLRRALRLAAPGGYIRSFLDEGESLLLMLREEYQTMLDGISARETVPSPDREFLERILQASGTDLSHGRERVPPPLEPLTEREKEILSFLTHGVSNKEIAGRIFVSENTIKFHLKNIYSKLAVSNRLQAISVARQLGLIH